jgi:hypothetical protein
MEISPEENKKLYICHSKLNIDDYINKNDYNKAFILLILVLERLDENEKIEFINYYSSKLNKINSENSHLVLRRLNCRKI